MCFLNLLHQFLIQQSECPEHKLLDVDILNFPKCTKSICYSLESVLAFTLHSLKVSLLNFCLQVLSQAIFFLCTMLPLNPLLIFLRSQPQSLGGLLSSNMERVWLSHAPITALIGLYFGPRRQNFCLFLLFCSSAQPVVCHLTDVK